MKSFYLLLSLIFCSQIFAQNWMPIHIGNHWQFLEEKISGSFQNYIWTYGIKDVVITKDTLINNTQYYLWFPGTYWIRYSSGDNKMYIWWYNNEKIYMDFNKVEGDTFKHINTFSHVEEGTDTLFSEQIHYKGFNYHTSSPQQGNTSFVEDFVEGLGWYKSNRYWSHSYYGFTTTSNNLIMAIIKDSSGNQIYFTNHFKPQVSLTPVLYVNSGQFVLNFSVDHPYNVPSKFCFIDTIFMKSFYSNGDSSIQNSDMFKLCNINGNYSFVKTLDTTLMKNGFAFNYRIIAKDKGIIPETSYSPDTGYYKCVWDFGTGVGEDDATLNKFSLSQNYPNPFNPNTKIKYSIPSNVILSEAKNLNVTLKIYDVLGREVTTLVNEEKHPGVYEVEFNTSELSSGIYFYKLQAENYSSTKKMIYLK